MLRIFHVLLIASVMFCGVHAVQPAWAHDEVAHHQADAVLDDERSGHKGSTDAAHVAHHHCPAALHQNAVAALDDRACGAPLHFVPRAAPLASCSRAPPIEPPAA